MSKSLLDRLDGKRGESLPVWMMRQVARVLLHDRALRQKVGSVMRRCFTSELAVEITLRPIRRFQFDVAILFSKVEAVLKRVQVS